MENMHGAFLSEEDVRRNLADSDWIRLELGVVRRDNRTNWVYGDNLEVIDAIRRAAPWLRGESDERPEMLISTALRPGDDNDRKALHRRCSLAREAVNGGSLHTALFVQMKVSDYALVKELEKVERNWLTIEARDLLDEVYAYFEIALRNHHDQETFRKTLMEKAVRYGEIRRKMSEWFGQMELLRMNEFCPPPQLRPVMTSVQNVEEDVGVLRRRARVPPASAKTRRWVHEQCEYYMAHPEALYGAERRRVYVSDIWEKVCDRAMSEYGIKTENDFARIRKTAVDTERRR